MLLRPLISFLLLAVLLAPGKENKRDAATVSGNAFSSTYFKLHYSFPERWSTENDELRMRKNQQRHQESIARLKAHPPYTLAHGTLTIRVFWIYDLLVASPELPGGKLFPPYVRIWALERSNNREQPGDYAKLLVKRDKAMMLRPQQKQMISGHKFMRSNLAYSGAREALFETVTRDHVVLFEIYGKNEQEVNELAKTMQSVRFDE